MEAKTIKKADVKGLLDRLAGEHRVYGPVKRKDQVSFEPIGPGDEVFLEYTQAKMSPKGIFFPQREDLFRYRVEDRDVAVSRPVEEQGEIILFGIHPCDAKGLQVLDRVFGGSPGDPYYQEKRSRATVVALGCMEPHSGCFCTALGGGPCRQEGADLLLVDIGDSYLIRIVTDRGGALLEKEGLPEAEEHHLAAAAEAVKRAEEAMEAGPGMENAEDILEKRFSDTVWDEVSEKCIGCGVCTYLCPTCHCFDLCEEAVRSEGKRTRIWDSCQYPLFTREASGHNPRNTQGKRMRQRIMHKFNYLPAATKMWGCTGCGRCVTECPVNLDIRQILTILLKLDDTQ